MIDLNSILNFLLYSLPVTSMIYVINPAPKPAAVRITVVNPKKRGGGSRTPTPSAEEIKRTAQIRGKGFTRSQYQRELGGGSAVKALREARQRGPSNQLISRIYE